MTSNKESILDEVKKTKRYSKILWSIGIIATFALLFFVGKWYQGKNQNPVEIEYTVTQRKTIKLSVEEDGEIKNPQDFNLAFLSSGRIEAVLVKEGDKVESGTKLALLDPKALELDVQRAKADIQQIYGRIAQQKAENTNLDFLQSEEELNSRISDISTTQQTTSQKIEEAFDLSLVQIETSLYRLRSVLDGLDSVFEFRNNRSISLQQVLRDSIGYNQLKNDFATLDREVKNKTQEWQSAVSSAEYADISRMLWSTKGVAEEIATMLDSAIYMFTNAAETQQVPLAKIQSYQAKISSEKDRMRQEIQNLVVAKKNTENALLNQQTQLTVVNNQVKQAEVRTENAKKITTQKEISKGANLSVSYAQLAQAQAQLERARYYLSLATLLSPIDGEVLSVDKEVGEIANATQPFIKILSDSNFIVEVYIEELDIAKIKVGQKANIRVAALDDQVLEGVTTYISSNATEDSNGVITYLVRLELENGRDFPIKEKMTASVEFIIDEVENVISLPIEAIFQNAEGKSEVLQADLSEVIVEIGLTDNTFVEIKKGLNAPDIKVIRNPLDFVNLGVSNQEVIRKKLLPEIKKDLEDLGFDEKEIQKVELGGMEDELVDRLREAQKEEKGGISSMMKN